MEQRLLGRSGLSVSRLCFGSLTVGPTQAKQSMDHARRSLNLDVIDMFHISFT